MRVKNSFLLLFILLRYSISLIAQSPNIPSDNQTYELLQDIEIGRGKLSNKVHSTLRPFSRSQAFALAGEGDAADSSSRYLREAIAFVNKDQGIWAQATDLPLSRKSLFANRAHFFAYKDADYTLVINPVLNAGYGLNSLVGNNASYNTRGLEICGTIYKNLSFYTYVTDNIVFPMNYVANYVGDNRVYPTANLTKPLPGGGYNFWQARAYLTYNPIKPLSFQFGHDRHFIGDGYRSFIMSDFGREFLFAKANFTSKRINLMFMGAQMINQFTPNWKNMAEKKYIAMHHLSIKLGKKLNIGLFETIIFSRTDSNGNNSGFDFSYANPIAFFRVVEHGLNSSDNAMLGLNYKYLPFKKVMVYGQLVLDEFKLDDVLAGTGWYGNKYALQTGIKILNPFGFDGFSLRAEYNVVRPYTFMHIKRAQSFVHNNIPVGHPLGSNFKETIVVLRYQLNKNWVVSLSGMHYIKGYDKDNKNYGGDIANKEYPTAVNIYGNYIGQGQRADVTFAEAHVSYMLFHNLFIDASYLNRNSNSRLTRYNNKTEVISLGLRYNIGRSNFMML